jgi:hypothetical protein
MILKLRVKLARWIPGKHYPCYQICYCYMDELQQRSSDQIAKA